MKKTLLIITLIVLLVMPALFKGGYKEETFFAMDTMVTLKIKGDKNNLEKAKEIVENCHKNFNAYSETSQVSILNKTGELSTDDTEIYKKASEYFNETEGAFDPTVKPLTDLWNITGENPKVPEEKAIKEVLAKIDGKKLVVKDKIYLLDNAQIDLGGIAKGYATDKTVEMLKENNVKEFVLNLGGNVYGYSQKDYVKIGVQEPFSPRGEILFTLKVKDDAVVSSGIYERCFEENGKVYHHIFDTKIGYPANTGISQVTIVGKDCTMCDAFSTAILAGGENLALKLKEKYAFEYIILSGGTLIKSADIEIFDIKDGYVVKNIE